MKTPFFYQFYTTTQSAWDSMYESIKAAEKSIFWEVFILKDDAVGNKFIDLLVEKAKAGLDVKLILDAMGSFELSSLAEARLKGAGVDLIWFNKLRPTANLKDWFRRVWKRDHRKVLIIDEKIVFVGGVNVHIESSEWDDLLIQLQGRVVRSFLYGFVKTYVKSGGSKNKVKQFLHPKLMLAESPLEPVEYFSHSPGNDYNRSGLRKLYGEALAAAKDTFTLVTPYYVPDAKFLKMIAQAHRRGVKVNIILPARTDHKFMNSLARAFFDITTRAGAHLHLLDKMNHSKAFLVDGKMGMIGSSNLNQRSWYIDEEAGVKFNNVQMAEELEKIFNNWIGASCPVDLKNKPDGWLDKIESWWAKKIFKNYV